MKIWEKLTKISTGWIQRGSVLRLPRKALGSSYPDPFTDFLVFDPLSKGVYGLITVSGHKAGLINIIFPVESTAIGHIGLRRQWLIENCQTWICPEGSAEDIWMRAPKSINEWADE